MMRIQPIVLCGGAGTRLWPLSRKHKTKPFLAQNDSNNLLTQTLERVNSDHFEDSLIVCGKDHCAHAAANPLAQSATFLIEDAPRGTAAAIALAIALSAPQTDAAAAQCNAARAAHRQKRPPPASPPDVMLVLPSDHVIGDAQAFHSAVMRGAQLALQGWIVCLGIAPTHAHTGYGYIERGSSLTEHAYAAARFIEKPPQPLADQLVASGNCFWNAGIFLFQPSQMRGALQQACPHLYSEAQSSISAAHFDGNRVCIAPGSFTDMPSLSLDHAVMEHCARLAVVPAAMEWSDLGSWDAVYAASPKSDAAANALSGDVFVHDSGGNLVRAKGQRVSLIGVNDLAVIVDGEDILILPLARAQDTRLAAQARDPN